MCNLWGDIIQPITGSKLRLAFLMKCKRGNIFTYVHISTRTLNNFLRLLRKSLRVNCHWNLNRSHVEDSKKEGLDPSYHKGYSTNIPSAGVNDSKTIYTDDLGRLHFFGKGNVVKD